MDCLEGMKYIDDKSIDMDIFVIYLMNLLLVKWGCIYLLNHIMGTVSQDIKDNGGYRFIWSRKV